MLSYTERLSLFFPNCILSFLPVGQQSGQKVRDLICANPQRIFNQPPPPPLHQITTPSNPFSLIFSFIHADSGLPNETMLLPDTICSTCSLCGGIKKHLMPSLGNWPLEGYLGCLYFIFSSTKNNAKTNWKCVLCLQKILKLYTWPI